MGTETVATPVVSTGSRTSQTLGLAERPSGPRGVRSYNPPPTTLHQRREEAAAAVAPTTSGPGPVQQAPLAHHDSTRMDQLLHTLRSEVRDLRDQGSSLTKQMWLLYVTFEDFVHIQHPEHSARLIETSLSSSPSREHLSGSTLSANYSTPDLRRQLARDRPSVNTTPGGRLTCTDRTPPSPEGEPTDTMKHPGQTATTDMSYVDKLVHKVSRMTCVGEDCQSEVEFDPRTSRFMRHELFDSSFEDGRRQWYDSQTVSPVTVSSGYDSDQEYMPTREDEIDTLLYGKSSLSLKRTKARSRSHLGNHIRRFNGNSRDDYVIRADDLYHENYASSSDADSPTHRSKRRPNGGAIYSKYSSSKKLDCVRSSHRSDYGALQRHGEAPRTPTRVDFRESTAVSPNVAKLTDVKRSMKEIIQDLACETSKGQFICASSTSAGGANTDQASLEGGSFVVITDPETERFTQTVMCPSQNGEQCAAVRPPNGTSLYPLPISPLVYSTRKRNASTPGALSASEDSDLYGFNNTSASSGFGNSTENSGHGGQVCSLYSPCHGEGSLSSDSGRASFVDYVDYDYEMWTAPNEGMRGSVERNDEEPIYETIPDELVTSAFQRPPPRLPGDRKTGDVRRWSMADSEHTYATIEPGSRLSLVDPPALPARNYQKKLELPLGRNIKSRGLTPRAHRKPRKPLHLDDMVKANDIVDMNGCHIYTVNDVLESFERLAGHLPKARDNIYTLVDDKETRRNLSQSLQMEDQLIKDGVLPRPGGASSVESLCEEDPKYLTPRPCPGPIDPLLNTECCSPPPFNGSTLNTSYTSRTKWNAEIAQLQGTYC